MRSSKSQYQWPTTPPKSSDGCFGVIVGIVIAVAVVALGYFVGDHFTATGKIRSGAVLERAFKPSETHVGGGIGSNGEYVTTVSSSSEKWVVLIDLDGEPTAIEATAQQWMRTEEGREVEVIEKIGGFSGRVLSRELHSSKRCQ